MERIKVCGLPLVMRLVEDPEKLGVYTAFVDHDGLIQMSGAIAGRTVLVNGDVVGLVGHKLTSTIVLDSPKHLVYRGVVRTKGRIVAILIHHPRGKPVFVSPDRALLTIEQFRPKPIRKGEIPEGAVAVSSPITGVFYRRTKPDEPLLVEVGRDVEAGSELCVMEVMKVFSTLLSEVEGKVVTIKAEDGKIVQEGETLMYILPKT